MLCIRKYLILCAVSVLFVSHISVTTPIRQSNNIDKSKNGSREVEINVGRNQITAVPSRYIENGKPTAPYNIMNSLKDIIERRKNMIMKTIKLAITDPLKTNDYRQSSSTENNFSVPKEASARSNSTEDQIETSLKGSSVEVLGGSTTTIKPYNKMYEGTSYTNLSYTSPVVKDMFDGRKTHVTNGYQTVENNQLETSYEYFTVPTLEYTYTTTEPTTSYASRNHTSPVEENVNNITFDYQTVENGQIQSSSENSLVKGLRGSTTTKQPYNKISEGPSYTDLSYTSPVIDDVTNSYQTVENNQLETSYEDSLGETLSYIDKTTVATSYTDISYMSTAEEGFLDDGTYDDYRTVDFNPIETSSEDYSIEEWSYIDKYTEDTSYTSTAEEDFIDDISYDDYRTFEYNPLETSSEDYSVEEWSYIDKGTEDTSYEISSEEDDVTYDGYRTDEFNPFEISSEDYSEDELSYIDKTAEDTSYTDFIYTSLLEEGNFDEEEDDMYDYQIVEQNTQTTNDVSSNTTYYSIGSTPESYILGEGSTTRRINYMDNITAINASLDLAKENNTNYIQNFSRSNSVSLPTELARKDSSGSDKPKLNITKQNNSTNSTKTTEKYNVSTPSNSFLKLLNGGYNNLNRFTKEYQPKYRFELDLPFIGKFGYIPSFI